VDISWLIETREDYKHVVLRWREVGGPPVSPPTRTGFGSRLINSSLKAYGDVSVAYEPQGLDVRMDLLLSRLEYRNELAAAL